jgi:glycosyltransferase involved in cell wall biosynthesis
MKIIRTIESFYPKVHGPANQAFMISSELEKKGIKSPVYTTNFDVERVLRKEKIKNVNVKRFLCKKRIFKYIFSPLMKKALQKKENKKEEFNIIHGHCYRSYQSDIGLKTAHKKGKPFVLSTHGTLLSYKHFVKFPWNLAFELYDLLTFKKTAKRADAVVVNSFQEYKEALKFGIARRKIHLIPVGIDYKQYQTKRKFTNKKTLNLLYVGRITRNRPLMPTLKAIKLINKNNVNKSSKKQVKLTIVGSEVRSSFSGEKGYVYELKRFVLRNGLKSFVQFIPELRKEKLTEQYKKADAFIYPSVYESFGQPILEAAASGLPIICSKVGVAADLFKHKEQKMFITNNPKQISKEIIKLFDSKLRRKISKKNVKIIKREFNWESIIKKYIKLYKSLI